MVLLIAVTSKIAVFYRNSFSPLGGGFVTFAKSNAKALLTGTPIKNATCKQVLRSPKALRGVSVCRWHTRLRTDRASRRDQRAAFEKALSAHSPKLYPVSKCDDGDNVFHSVLLSKTLTPLTPFVTPSARFLSKVKPFFRRVCGCSDNGYRNHETACLR